MEGILLAAAVLACPIGMGAMMRFMGKGMGKKKPVAEPPDAPTDLRAEHARLGAEIERLERGHNGQAVRVTEDAR